MLTLQQIATELAAHEFDRFCVQTYTTNSNPRCFVRVYGNHKELVHLMGDLRCDSSMSCDQGPLFLSIPVQAP